jgi:hypothetical protein
LLSAQFFVATASAFGEFLNSAAPGVLRRLLPFAMGISTQNNLFGGTAMGKFVFLAVLMLTGSPCCAKAIAMWTAPWTYTPTASTLPFGLTTADLFADAGNGAAGAAGELLSGTPAVSKAKAGAMNSGVFVAGTSAKARVDFTRPFTLSGSPGGWDIWLTVLTSGTFTNVGTGASAQLERYAAIFQTSPIMSGTFASTGMIVQGGPTPCCAPITTLKDVVPDGTYETMGYLLITASGPHSATFGAASANFFDTMTVITLQRPWGFPRIRPGRCWR